MVDKAGLSLMLDYYGSFLTERQLELMRMSADEDMSLSEISEQVGVSRQAVRDSLSKAAKELSLLEERLGLVERDRRLMAVCEKLEAAEETSSGEELLTAVKESAEEIRALIR